MTRVFMAAAIAAAFSAQNPAPSSAPSADTSCSEMATALQRMIGQDSRMRDWPQLARYREANRTVAAPAAGDSRVVFMGDSITDAWQQPRFGGFFPGKPYVDRGISGQTTPQMLVRFKPDVIDLKPKAVVILAGTNDIANNTGPMTDEEIEGNIESMVDLAKAHGIKVVLSSIMPTGAYHVAPNGVPQSTLRPMSRIKTLNEWMKRFAGANGHVYLDYFTPMLDDTGMMKAELTGDDLHPNAAGYAIMAPLAQAAIDKALR
ncbi:MAG TPA: SGNH/GDSL hydrolase family protein [Vicinamibacterales bacterium]|nr:SGNH/GDSL hydrolase family protein [Vicinamibacterales bacterium]